MTETAEKIVPNAGYKCKLDARHRKDVHYQMNKNFGAAKVAYNWCRKEHLRRYHEDWMPVRDEKIKELQEKYTEVVSDEDNFKKFTKSYRSIMKNYKKEKSVLKQKLKELKSEYDNSDSFIGYLSEYDEFFKDTSDLRKQPSAKEFRQFVKENEDFSWIKEADSNSIDDVFYSRYKSAYKAFLRGTARTSEKKEDENGNEIPRKYPEDYGFPTFAKKISATVVRFPATRAVLYGRHMVRLPKIKNPIKVAHDRELPEGDFNDSYATVSYDGIDYYLSFRVHHESEPLNKIQSPILGIDTGLKNIVTLSDGTYVENPVNSGKVKELLDAQDRVKSRISILKNKLAKEIEEKEGKKLSQKEIYRLTSKRIKRLTLTEKRIRIKVNDYLEHQMKLVGHEVAMTNPKGIIFKKNDNGNKFKKKFGGRKGKNFAKKKQRTPIYKFKSIIANAARRRGIPVREVTIDLFNQYAGGNVSDPVTTANLLEDCWELGAEFKG